MCLVDILVVNENMYSPLPLSIFYNNDKRLTENFNKSVMDVFNSYNNVNYLLLRTKPYNPAGRIQSEAESDALAEPIKNLLSERNITYKTANGDTAGYDEIVKDVLDELKERKII